MELPEEGIILPIDKPYRWTSADVIRKVKYAAVRHFGRKNLKVGHAGTLDPLATGILLVCIGKATKKAEELQRHEKEYVAGVTFGATTPSYDLEKDIDREYPVDGITVDALEKVLKGFVGEQMQVAPLFSAKSVDGVRAYETARKLFRQGLPVEDQGILTASRINIYEIELLSMSEGIPKTQKDDGKGRIRVADISGRKLVTAMIRVRCSKGTYIRALARDLGEAMGSGAFLSSLRRTKNGDFNIEDAISLDKVMELFSENL
ncbi:MAG: tRNA pseudouridine(55) synthase TruB [Bacteroidales bacterium]|nr:tRNA pseudouridine(55) synthase TruB [Bacteroidales bacterium]